MTEEKKKHKKDKKSKKEVEGAESETEKTMVDNGAGAGSSSGEARNSVEKKLGVYLCLGRFVLADDGLLLDRSESNCQLVR